MKSPQRRQGIYLEQNPPNRPQFRVGRRDPGIRPVITVHTTESRLAPAANVAKFIANRDTPGSYHLVGDPAQIIQLVRFENEAFHDGTGSNRWSIGIALAMDANEWETLPKDSPRRRGLINVAAHMALDAAQWLTRQGLQPPAPIHLEKRASELTTATGFISHARRDPTRRSDPGEHFPWTEFLDTYADLLSLEAPTLPPPQLRKPILVNTKDKTIELQELANAIDPKRNLTVDGIPGPLTIGASVDIMRIQHTRLATYARELAAAEKRITELEQQNDPTDGVHAAQLAKAQHAYRQLMGILGDDQ